MQRFFKDGRPVKVGKYKDFLSGLIIIGDLPM
jgi:hypothetical protein